MRLSINAVNLRIHHSDKTSGGIGHAIARQLAQHLPTLFGCGTASKACRQSVGSGMDFDSLNTRQRQRLLDPSEMVFMTLYTGLSRDMAVVAMMLEELRETRKDEAQGEV